MTEKEKAASWRELLGPQHLGAVTVLAGGVLVGAVNIYLASAMLPTAVAELGGQSFSAWNMTVYLVAMVIATMLATRFLARRGTVGACLIGFTAFLVGSLACAVSTSASARRRARPPGGSSPWLARAA